MNRTRTIWIAGSLLVVGFAVSGCATEDYVDQHIATVNGRIDELNGHYQDLNSEVVTINGRVATVDRNAQEALARADAANQAAHANASDIQGINAKLERMDHQLAHLEQHHKRKTWSDVSRRKKATRHRRHW